MQSAHGSVGLEAGLGHNSFLLQENATSFSNWRLSQRIRRKPCLSWRASDRNRIPNVRDRAGG